MPHRFWFRRPSHFWINLYLLKAFLKFGIRKFLVIWIHKLTLFERLLSFLNPWLIKGFFLWRKWLIGPLPLLIFGPYLGLKTPSYAKIES